MFDEDRYEKSYSRDEALCPLLKECRSDIEKMVGDRKSYTASEPHSFDSYEKLETLEQHFYKNHERINQFRTLHTQRSNDEEEYLRRWLYPMSEEIRKVWRRGIEHYIQRFTTSAKNLVERIGRQRIQMDKKQFDALCTEASHLIDEYESIEKMVERVENIDLGYHPPQSSVKEKLDKLPKEVLEPLTDAVTEMRSNNVQISPHRDAVQGFTLTRSQIAIGVIGLILTTAFGTWGVITFFLDSNRRDDQLKHDIMRPSYDDEKATDIRPEIPRIRERTTSGTGGGIQGQPADTSSGSLREPEKT